MAQEHPHLTRKGINTLYQQLSATKNKYKQFEFIKQTSENFFCAQSKIKQCIFNQIVIKNIINSQFGMKSLKQYQIKPDLDKHSVEVEIYTESFSHDFFWKNKPIKRNLPFLSKAIWIAS